MPMLYNSAYYLSNGFINVPLWLSVAFMCVCVCVCVCVCEHTLAGRLEGEGLEATGDGGGVDDFHAVLAAAPPVQRDHHDQDHHRQDPRTQPRVQHHLTAALHLYQGEGGREGEGGR